MIQRRPFVPLYLPFRQNLLQYFAVCVIFHVFQSGKKNLFTPSVRGILEVVPSRRYEGQAYMKNSKKNSEYLSSLSVWSLALGGVIGWGCFILPGSRFLPDGGAVGSVIGIVLASLFAIVICSNYSSMVKQFPEIGGSYVFTRHIMGEDHAFLAVWCLILAYLSLLWANATAFSLMIRYVVGDALQWGFHYNVAGYDVYLGEVLTTVVVIIILGLLTAYRSRLTNILRTIFAICLFVSIVVIFVCVVSKNGLSISFTPAFSDKNSAPIQVLNVFILAPWMFVGFETVTHAIGESKFSVTKIFTYAGIAIGFGMMIYVMLTLVASSSDATFNVVHSNLPAGETTIYDIPVFANTLKVMGKWGTVFLMIATMSAILSSVLVFFRAAARVIRITSDHDLLPKPFAKVSEEGVPVNACLLIIAISIPIPLLGRAVIGWNADVSTLSVAVVYAYISICTIRTMKKRSPRYFLGFIGLILSVSILGLLLLPSVFSDSTLSIESYFMLAVWSLLGILYYWRVFSKDKKNRFGKSTIMWLMMLLLLFFSTNVWVRLLTEHRLNESHKLSEDTVDTSLRNSSLIQFTIISIALIIVFNLFKTVITRRKEADMQMLRAQESDKAKSMFLSNMSHDIRTPMNAIVGMTDILLREDLPEHAHEYVYDIKHSGERLLTIINDILDFSKIESGKMELEEEDYEFTELMRELSVIFLNYIGGKPVELIYEIPTDIPSAMRGDMKRFSQIMTNLVGNAAKYTDYGFVRMQIEIKERHDDQITFLISVYDSGRGIREEDYERIFSSFSQADTKKNRSIEGTGLGLAISRQLVELMGGSIHVESEYGRGSRFYFDLTQTIVDPTPVAALNTTYTNLKGAYYLDNPYEDMSFRKLADDLNLSVMQIEDTDTTDWDSYDYFITDDLDLAHAIHKKATSCRVAFLQNPMLTDHIESDIEFINKPLYFRNLCAFLNGEAYDHTEADTPVVFTAPDARVLIVDDMPMNLKVVAELLTPLQMQIDKAMNGREALDRIYAGHYDIILMDHMMPVMDGIEAVTLLRSRTEKKYRDLPVIALTANATTEAKKLFFESGFSDFLPKPVHLEDIVVCIRKWLPSEKVHDTSVPLSDISVMTASDIEVDTSEINIPGVDNNKGIENSGNAVLFKDLLGDVYELIDEKSDSIRAHLENDEIKSYTTEVHALKTTCRMIGAMELAENFFTLEKLGTDNNVTKLKEYTPSVLAAFSALKPYLKPYAKVKAEPDQDYNKKDVMDVLDKLEAAIADFDLTVAEKCTDTLAAYVFDEAISSQIKKLCELVTNLDYEEAGELIDSVREMM